MERTNEWKPKTPMNTMEVKKNIDNRSVIIKGKWADVKDTDSFFDNEMSKGQ